MREMFPKEIDESKIYPAEHPFRIITDASVPLLEPLQKVLADYTVTSPLVTGKSSSGGKYVVYETTVRMENRAEHNKLDAAIRSLNGVRILL